MDNISDMVICFGCNRICNTFAEYDRHLKFKKWLLREDYHNWRWLKLHAQYLREGHITGPLTARTIVSTAEKNFK